jgi:hypothetical protein
MFHICIIAVTTVESPYQRQKITYCLHQVQQLARAQQCCNHLQSCQLTGPGTADLCMQPNLLSTLSTKAPAWQIVVAYFVSHWFLLDHNISDGKQL